MPQPFVHLQSHQIPVLALHYLPCTYYFAVLAASNKVCIDYSEHYVKQSYRNRCYIRGANKVERLSVPVVHITHKQSMAQVQLNSQERWPQIHWRSISSAYGKSPFFEAYSPYFLEIFEHPPASLVEFNEKILTLCLKLLRLNVQIDRICQYQKSYSMPFIDLRDVFDGEIAPLTTDSGYIQMFGNEFEKNLSVIDLLFCEGPHSLQYLKELAQALTEQKSGTGC
jgi:hypothetical protein